MLAAKLDAELLERFYARLRGRNKLCSGRAKDHDCRPLSASTVRQVHFIIRAALDRAVRWRYLSNNEAALAQAAGVRAARSRSIIRCRGRRNALPSLRPALPGRTATTRKVDRLSCLRFGSARYSVPTRLISSTVELRCDEGPLLVIEPCTGRPLRRATRWARSRRRS